MASRRPVVILGAGILGRRIACVFVAGGYRVHIHDPSLSAREGAAKYVDDYTEDYQAFTEDVVSRGSCSVFCEINAAVSEAWLIIEAVPENLDLKINIFGDIDNEAPSDCIFASNSSSFRSSLMLEKVSPRRRKRVLNVHFYMPPTQRAVELMTCGETQSDIFPILCKILQSCGMLPFVVRRESTGYIFNRLWAAIKREIILILAEGVSEPAEIDMLWEHIFQSSVSPCKLMDQVGLDTVASIEDNYILERGLDGSKTVSWLREHYIRYGRLGAKSPNGGLYSLVHPNTNRPLRPLSANDSLVYFLDVGVGANLRDINQLLENGKILGLDTEDNRIWTVVAGLTTPDGIAISFSVDRMFWSSMGHLDSNPDGSIMSARLDGSDMQILISGGELYTPKQLTVEEETRMLYFCDREGMNVQRCDFSGHSREVLVQLGGNCSVSEAATCWCVGVAVDSRAKKLYWSQKGPSKAGRGCICRAGMDIPAGETADNRSDVETLFEGLPEPVDLDLDMDRQMLYWTDRGEHPRGCTLNRAYIGDNIGADLEAQVEILARHFHEPTGLKLDTLQERVYVTDLGGSVYRLNLDGSNKEILLRDGGSYTGIALGERKMPLDNYQ
ncbi:hypothetical protein BDV59DRAFT_196697 [Aspergillus ambiguus]|uniref:3-hydroxyacyl-CoA dehydrogenase family protein n=1 Tax=Aspergillus ambiguus TaxID=176160 RepID=UPI003CCCE84F